MQPEDRLVDEQVVSEMTGIKIRTLRKWRLQGRGPIVRRVEGRLVRYSLRDVQDWMHKQPSLRSQVVPQGTLPADGGRAA
jgi:phage terminase Nu1 subunit (DNA packaging protein)